MFASLNLPGGGVVRVNPAAVAALSPTGVVGETEVWLVAIPRAFTVVGSCTEIERRLDDALLGAVAVLSRERIIAAEGAIADVAGTGARVTS